MASAHTLQRLANASHSVIRDAQLTIDLCGGDRLDAWRIALGKAVIDPQKADYWIEVADAICAYQTVPTPAGVAQLLADAIEAESVTRFTMATVDPRVRLWAKTVKLWTDTTPKGGCVR